VIESHGREGGSPATLTITLWALASGTLVLAPSLLYLFRVLKRAPDAHEPTPR
jgi:hypothetical protein